MLQSTPLDQDIRVALALCERWLGRRAFVCAVLYKAMLRHDSAECCEILQKSAQLLWPQILWVISARVVYFSIASNLPLPHMFQEVFMQLSGDGRLEERGLQ